VVAFDFAFLAFAGAVSAPAGCGASACWERWRTKAMTDCWVSVLGRRELTDDNEMENIGATANGVVTSFHYSAAHDSPENKAYVAEMAKLGVCANFHSVGGYDGMHVIYEALRKTGGDSNGDKLLAAMKGLSWMSVRGPVTLNAETRDMIQNVYLRRVENVKGVWSNVEFDKVEKFKDPGV
jgi:branched-chain amino acid transport system substrate-binding protein